MSASRLKNRIEFFGGPYDGRTETMESPTDDLRSFVRLPLPLEGAPIIGRLLGRPILVGLAAYELDHRAGRPCYRYVGRDTPPPRPRTSRTTLLVRWFLRLWE
jgi:hypothetical protein